ncbi:bifunctional 4-hydroxy-2-oxoglutarate aldolase/2-dehydro-3-deoxy-phosphogluconate aldolase [Paremcibacter congregatus]|uniref:bifunctional 4-hydroxy-2-oxoglutarate aldolase/2-dehydro-3-deoxy-phosphogluconate aldolase n=1 Tax=Paremcibacter congregatus TaxID=2043170 RepID=UPI003A94DDB1
MPHTNASLPALLDGCAVIPVLTISHIEDALPLAEALVKGGLNVLELTLRTPVALEALRLIAAEIPEAIIGAGTVNTPELLTQVTDAGARFAVSPGHTDRLLDAAENSLTPLLPGVATASEVMHLMERGYSMLKLFPAEAIGGRELLKSFSGPLAHAKFCPTGGISPDIAPSYLSLPNVVCVGGSWMVSAQDIANRDWAKIETLARAAARF